MSDDLNPTLGISRRDLLKRGAVVGALAWATPVVTNFASPAFASGTPVDEDIISCVLLQVTCGANCFFAKWEDAGNGDPGAGSWEGCGTEGPGAMCDACTTVLSTNCTGVCGSDYFNDPTVCEAPDGTDCLEFCLTQQRIDEGCLITGFQVFGANKCAADQVTAATCVTVTHSK